MKSTEIEVFNKPVSGRPQYGQQWNKQSMRYLLNIGVEGAVNRAFKKYLENKSSCIIVGVGGGGDVARLSSYVDFILGVDLSKKRLLEAKQLTKGKNCDFVLCDAERMPFKESYFETLVCRATLHHLPHTDRSLQLMAMALKENGIVILHEPGLLNPVALIARRFFPTSIHTPGEKPFVPYTLKRTFKKSFKIIEFKTYYVFSNAIPVLGKFSPIFRKKRLLQIAYLLDRKISKTPLRQLSWELLIVGQVVH